jgi:hypothetical protein
MKKFRVLMYEDSEEWQIAFEFNIAPKLLKEGIEINILPKSDTDTIMQDLEFLPHLVMVDYDLGKSTGELVLEYMNGDPDLSSTSIYFYSGGEDLDTLQAIANKYACHVSCYSKGEDDEDDELEVTVINKGKSI